ncbi:MAG: hypothetical protein ACT4QA_10830 [Panacagrimonas sp.]
MVRQRGADFTQFSQDDLFLGAQAPLFGNNVFQYPFDGVLDDVRLYDRELVAFDVTELFGTELCDAAVSVAP